MNCEKIRELLFDYIDGELDSATEKAIREHLDECAECKKEYEMMLGMSEAIKESYAYAPSELHSVIMSGLEAEKKRVRRARLIRNLTAVGGCAAAFLITINSWLGRGGNEPATPPENNKSEADGITLKAENIFTGESFDEAESIVLSEGTFSSFVGEWQTVLKDGTTVTLMIGEDKSVVVCVRQKNGYEIYYDGMLEFTRDGITLSESDGNDYCQAIIKAVKDNGVLYFDIVSGETPWGEAT